MGLRYIVGKCSASMKQHVISANCSSYPRARGLCALSNNPNPNPNLNPNPKSGSKPTYLPPFRSFFNFTTEDIAAEIVAFVKSRRCFKPKFGYYGDPRLDKDDPCIRQLAKDVIKHYNKEQNVKLKFVSVLSACRGNTVLERHIVVQACDPLAARVPLKLSAICARNKRDRYVVKEMLPLQCAPFISIIDETKDEDNKRNKRQAYVETLLYANIRNCPIIDKRLGLKNEHGLLYRDDGGYVVKVSLHDDILLAHAMFALNQQNENQKKGSRLRFSRVVGAWLERVGKERVVYHIMLEALKGKVKRRFFAAVASKPINEDLELLDWVVADSPRATMS